jgi:hypothetical protein
MSEEDVREFIYARMSTRPEAKVVSVSVRKYPSEYSATIWLDEAPTPDVRHHVYELEAELANLGIACSILVRSDRERPFGGIDTLHTKKGAFSYRYLKADPMKDEDVVYVFSLYKGSRTYRYRVSVSGTLASMLRMRNQFDEDRILEVYKDQIRSKIDRESPRSEEIMLDSRHQQLFGLK